MTAIPDDVYRAPRDLMVTPTPLRRVLVVGSCLMAGWSEIIASDKYGCPSDFLLTNNIAQLPQQPCRPINDYDFQVVQIALRAVLNEQSYFRLPYGDLRAYEEALEDCKERLGQALDAAMQYNIEHGLLTFVVNFIVPQQNPLGRLLPRHDLRNIVYFVERLNEALATEINCYKNSYLFDFNEVVNTLGKRYFSDEVVWSYNHASALSSWSFENDQKRLEALQTVDTYYPVDPETYVRAAWSELVAMYRTARQIDPVKLVVVDLDDTMWRGVAAESEEVSAEQIEGWPLGLAEALGYLKRRGVLLAILSKNDERRVTDIWGRLVDNRRLSLDDFAIKKINWRPKAENFEEILRETNLLPRNTVYIDDNPVERASLTEAFSGLRSFGPVPYLWRRILLWSAETQVPTITAESSVRTEMVKAQVVRDEQRQRLSRDDFLASLHLQFDMFPVTSANHPKFQRTLELINKTNQFNTTGRRWTHQECVTALAGGTHFYAFEVTDKFTSYGLVGVLVVTRDKIEQFVMSCRVVGMEVEVAAIAEVVRTIRSEIAVPVYATLVETELNLLCRDLYSRCGFEMGEAGFVLLEEAKVAVPGHIQLLKTEPSEMRAGIGIAIAPPLAVGARHNSL